MGMQGDSDVAVEDVCEDVMQNLGGRLVLILMITGILVGEVVVVAVGVMVMVAVGVISFSEKQCLSVTEVECLRGWSMEVDDLKLEVGAVARLIWACLN